jgi:ABC-type histidine transport system ATPase subunit
VRFPREVVKHLVFLHKGLIEEECNPTEVLARPYFPPKPIDREITSFMISLVPP